MIKLKNKKTLEHLQHELKIIEFNIEALNNNILNLATCFKNHRHNLDMRNFMTDIQQNTDCHMRSIHKMPI